jgi:hypothetical protein
MDKPRRCVITHLTNPIGENDWRLAAIAEGTWPPSPTHQGTITRVQPPFPPLCQVSSKRRKMDVPSFLPRHSPKKPPPLRLPRCMFEKEPLMAMAPLLEDTGIALSFGTHLPLLPHSCFAIRRVLPKGRNPEDLTFQWPEDLPVRDMSREHPLPPHTPEPERKDHLHQHVFIQVESAMAHGGGGMSLAMAVAFGAYRPVLVVSIDTDHDDVQWVDDVLDAFNVGPFPPFAMDDKGHVHYPDPTLLQPGKKLMPNKVVLDFTQAFKEPEYNRQCALRKVWQHNKYHARHCVWCSSESFTHA